MFFFCKDNNSGCLYIKDIFLLNLGYGPGPMPLWPTPTDGLQPSRTLSVRADRSFFMA